MAVFKNGFLREEQLYPNLCLMTAGQSLKADRIVVGLRSQVKGGFLRIRSGRYRDGSETPDGFVLSIYLSIYLENVSTATPSE